MAPRKTKIIDAGLIGELALLLQGKRVGMCGSSSRLYVRQLREHRLECELFDPGLSESDCPEDPEVVKGSRLQTLYDGVVCLGIDACLLGKGQSNFLDEMATHAAETIVLSWAISSQDGDIHLNPRSNSYVIYQLWKRGFWICGRTTLLMRAHCSLDSIKATLMVFSRGKVPNTFAERRAVRRIIGADIERLKTNNRQNGSLINAMIGKAVRVMASAQNHSTNVLDRLRVLGHDATRFRRPWPRLAESSQIEDGTHFFPVCFTCGKHFRFVRLALISLGRCAPKIKKIYIYIDKGDPLSGSECEQLRVESQCPIIFRITKYPMSSWGGPKFLLSQLGAYREIAEQMSTGDFLVKFDSDVLFLSNWIFQLVANRKAGSVGTHVSKLHGSEGQEEYMQGGCYFIGAKELKAMMALPIAKRALAPTKWGKMPEDQFFTGLLCQCGVRPFYNDFLYFDPVFVASGSKDSQLDGALQAIPATAGVLHFEGNQWDRVDRSNMRRVADRLFGPLPPALNPYHPATAQKDLLLSTAKHIPGAH